MASALIPTRSSETPAGDLRVHEDENLREGPAFRTARLQHVDEDIRFFTVRNREEFLGDGFRG